MYTIWHCFEFEDSKAGIRKLFVLSIPPPLPPLPSLIPPPSLPSPPSLPLPQLAADGAGGDYDGKGCIAVAVVSFVTLRAVV